MLLRLVTSPQIVASQKRAVSLPLSVGHLCDYIMPFAGSLTEEDSLCSVGSLYSAPIIFLFWEHDPIMP
jgi:hypothetical protein